MKPNDFSVPRRMSKSAFVILFFNVLKSLSNYFFILVFIELFKSSETFLDKMLYVLGIGGICISIATVLSFISYYFKKYYIEDENLIFIHGLMHKEVTSVPLCRIQSLRTKQGLMYRLFDMRGISFDTLASQGKEVEMILDEDDWNALIAQIDRLKVDEANESNPGISDTSSIGTIETKDLPTVSNLNLIKGAFCQNHLQGMTVLLGILISLYNQLGTFDKEATVYIVDYVDRYTNPAIFSLSSILLLVVLLYFVMLLLWMGKVFLHYYNTVIQINQEQLLFEYGLVSRNSSRFSYDKICTLHVKQNLLEKLLNCSTIIFRQALNATDTKQGSDVKLYGSQAATYFLNWWLGIKHVSSQALVSARSGYGMMGFSLQFQLFITFVSIFVFYYLQWYIGFGFSVAYLLIMLLKDYLAVRRSHIVLKEDYVEIHSGSFAAVTDYFKYSNIEVVRLKSTPFTPYYHRVSLFISTNGSSFVVRSLKEDEAREIYELLLCKCNAFEMFAST